MDLWRRLRSGTNVPSWAGFFSPDEYEEFRTDLRAELDSGAPYRLGDDVVEIEGLPGPHGLTNLAQACHAADRDTWPELMATHFRNVRIGLDRDMDALADNFEAVRSILRVRLHPDEQMGGMRPDEIRGSRRYAPGILASLTYDFPDSTHSVPLGHVERWPVDIEVVWRIATDNVSLETAPEREVLQAREASVDLAIGNDFYVASRCLRLADLLPPGMTNAIFAVPNRHTLIWHGMSDTGVVSAIQLMSTIAADGFKNGPGSISDQLYWWRPDRVTQLPVRVEKDRLQFVPPDDFVDLLNSLPSS